MKVILVNNAAQIGSILPLKKKKIKDMVLEYNLNIVAPTILCKKYIQQYQKSSKAIINIGSGAAINSIPSWSTYCASKAALDMLSRVIHEENYPKFKTHSIYPGIVDTNMQVEIRKAKKKDFSLVEKFTKYHINGELLPAITVAKKLLYILENPDKFNEIVLSIRDVNIK